MCFQYQTDLTTLTDPLSGPSPLVRYWTTDQMTPPPTGYTTDPSSGPSFFSQTLQGRLKTGQLIVRFSIIFLTGQIAKKLDCPVKNRTPGNPIYTQSTAKGKHSI